MWRDRRSRNRDELSFFPFFPLFLFFSFISFPPLLPVYLTHCLPEVRTAECREDRLGDKRGGPRNTARGETGETKMRYGPGAQKM